MKDRRLPFPDFLGIGAQRSGSTWLHHTLSRHPRLWFPPVKELHYFDRVELPDSQEKRYSKHLGERLKSYFSKPRNQCLAWDLRYFLGRENDKWYGRLFERANQLGLTSGEITPAYSILSESTIRHILDLNPNIRIVFIMRDPVERSWSQVIQYYKTIGKGNLGNLTVEGCLDYLDREGCRKRSDYLTIIDNWKKHVPEDNLLIGFYDQLQDCPEVFLRNILNFLSVDPDEYPDWIALGARRYNTAAHGYPIPKPVREFLIERYTGQVHALQMYGPYPKTWLSRYRLP